jgi:hypothetical protein
MARPTNTRNTAFAANPSRILSPHVRAWVAEAWIDAAGQKADSVIDAAAAVFAVSVHEEYPASEEARVRLLEDIGREFSSRVPAGTASLWVFPGGYFGFDAAKYVALKLRGADTDQAWIGFDRTAVLRRLPQIVRTYPREAKLAFGADDDSQQLWITWARQDGSLERKEITRECSPLPARKFPVGTVTGAFFVCGEFTGSGTSQNGPFCGQEILNKPASQLADCQLLVDLAHSRIRGSVYGPPGPRQVHQRQMERFSAHGAAVLTHHHPGKEVSGRARNDSQSAWVVYKGGEWLDDSQVTALP